MGRRDRRDRGAASIWLLVVGLTIVAAGIAGAAIGAAAVARHEARTAADLGALAGAPWTVAEPELACARAGQIVAANGGRLTSCAVVGVDLVVSVEVSVSPLPGMHRTAAASARAGPVRAGSPPRTGTVQVCCRRSDDRPAQLS